jgi:hypothetical protein
MTRFQSALSYTLGLLALWWGFVIVVLFALVLGMALRPKPLQTTEVAQSLELPWALPALGMLAAGISGLIHDNTLHRSRPWIAALILNTLAMLLVVIYNTTTSASTANTSVRLTEPPAQITLHSSMTRHTNPFIENHLRQNGRACSISGTTLAPSFHRVSPDQRSAGESGSMKDRQNTLVWMRDVIDHLARCHEQLRWAGDGPTTQFLTESMLVDLNECRQLCERLRNMPRTNAMSLPS